MTVLLIKNVIVTILFIIFFAILFVLIEYIVSLIKMIDFSSLIEKINDLI